MKESDKLQILKPTANAIFDIARELGMIKEIYNELSECSKLFQDIDIKKYFFDRSISEKNKKELIDKRLKPILSKETYAFVSILTEHNSIDVLPDIVALYKEIADDYNNIVRVRIITAGTIDDNTVKDIIQTVKCFSNNEISYETVIDENIIGGIIVYIGSVVYDYSIKNQIDLLHNKFTYGN
ncbi:ATP synthase F1 subunit delta [Brachyspira hampsonii]|uniref:ATP synthase subunit delta n=1 Tax=Brachyspira hampsonii 30446 TaxID=1289135 RepID=A0A2U4EZS8_9SPIR|nr:ATP synthase F1 subunit delta [Brachyspira hampsonii]EKV57252.1 F0F1-type ATP synthase subunit delta [Brachyspira hampsonii 30446]MBW5390027.1 ATP synthase F1 subunit delta [Brachyspira hampsonii]MBW5394397.1 ATP synthase F1 subunit delta [Brachyspira hampsonii]OEJ17294.1 ATP synthase F1 subunit delta [Brachyspira hampsonii]PTY39608.1 ATP synthase subunit delta [Brachyspira hampsonii bv. II]